MNEQRDPFLIGWWAENLEELDREIGRMATLCGVRLLDPGVITHVLQNDDSVCGTRNRPAFTKLRDLLMLHFAIREKSVETVGEAQTAAIEDYIVERLRKSFPDLKGKWPPV